MTYPLPWYPHPIPGNDDLNKLESIQAFRFLVKWFLLNDALCQVWLNVAQWFW